MPVPIIRKSSDSNENAFDVVIVGAGFAGLYLLHRLRQMGFAARVLEAGGGVGGTWYWNRYPGARCDVESMEYSYQFSEELQQQWEWSERYATQDEILRYANHVADRFDLRRDIRFDSQVMTATFDEAAGRWELETEGGESIAGRYFIMATGCLSSTNTPDFKGLDSFRGPTYHTGDWPHEGVDFTGLRVGIIGTGSSAIQSIPLIAAEAAHLDVFQRTANYAVPAHNAPLDPGYVAEVKASYPARRASAKQNRNGILAAPREMSALSVDEAAREEEYRARWAKGGLSFMGAFDDLLLEREANFTAAEFVRQRIHEQIDDPEVADLLSPHTVIGCKRVCVDIGYFRTYNRANVSLIDVSENPIEEITPGGLRVAGEEYAFDALVLATGFDAMTGALLAVDIRGPGDRSLRDKWAEGPRTYLGLATAGFPNLFTVTGPGSPSVLTNMLPSIEQHVEWITDCIEAMRARGKRRIEATAAAEDAWVDHVNDVANQTLFPSCNSWYLGANVPGKPRVFMPYIGFPPYVEKCNQVAANDYEGFALS